VHEVRGIDEKGVRRENGGGCGDDVVIHGADERGQAGWERSGERDFYEREERGGGDGKGGGRGKEGALAWGKQGGRRQGYMCGRLWVFDVGIVEDGMWPLGLGEGVRVDGE